MASLSFAVDAGTIQDTPTASGLETLANAQLAPLLTDIITGVSFTANDQARDSRSLRLAVTYTDGAAAIGTPFLVKAFTGRTVAEVAASASAFFAANTGYFFSGLFTQILTNTARRATIVYGLVMYNTVLADGASHYAGSGAGGGGGGTVGGSGTAGKLAVWTSGTDIGDSALTEAANTITSTKEIITNASAAARAGLNLPHGAAPTVPVNGDFWSTTVGFFGRVNGATVGPFGAGTGTIGGSIANTQVAVGSGVDTIGGSSGLIYASNTLTIKAPNATNAYVLMDGGTGGAGIASYRVNAVELYQLYGTAAFLSFYDVANAYDTFSYVPGTAQTSYWATASQFRFAAGTTTRAPIRIAQGAAPSVPTDGDLWTTTTGLFVRINGATVGPLAAGGGTIAGSIALNQVAVGSAANTIAGSASLTFNGTTLAAPAITATVSAGSTSPLAISHSTVSFSNPTVNIVVGTMTTANPNPLGLQYTAHTVTFTVAPSSYVRQWYIGATTFAANATRTIDEATALAIAAPIAGTNMTLTRASAIYIESGAIVTAASSTATAGLNLPHGAAPTAPFDGDVWTTTTAMFVRINGATVQLGAGTISGAATSGQVAYGSGSNTLTSSSTFLFSTTDGLSVNRPNTSGTECFGFGAGNTTMSGTANTLIGNSAGLLIAASHRNTAVGWHALATIPGSASDNTAIGSSSQENSTGNVQCTSVGSSSLNGATAKSNCTAIGYMALNVNGGNNNTAVGAGALAALANCNETTAVGAQALAALTSGTHNNAFGYNTLITVQTGTGNNAFGHSALKLATGTSNSAFGDGAGALLSTGSYNTAVGGTALANCQTTDYNTAVGYQALVNTTSGANTAIGFGAGAVNTSGTGNLFLGLNAGDGTANNASNRMVAGSDAVPLNDIWFGKGESNAAATAYTIHGTRGAGADKVGGGVILAGGESTGSGVGGSVKIQTAPAGGSSSTLNTLVDRLTADQLGNVVLGSAAIATNATDGFLYMVTCAGTPTGAPTGFTGRCAFVYDTSANKIWVYNGSWRGIVVV